MNMEELKEKVATLNRCIQLSNDVVAFVEITTPQSDLIEEQERIEIQRKAFEACRKSNVSNCIDEYYQSIPRELYDLQKDYQSKLKYKTFEDYLNQNLNL